MPEAKVIAAAACGIIALVIVIVLTMCGLLGTFGDAANCWVDADTGNSFCDYTVAITVTEIPQTSTSAAVEGPLCDGLNKSISTGDMHALHASMSSSRTSGFFTWTWTGYVYPRINMTEKVGNSYERSPLASMMAGNKIEQKMNESLKKGQVLMFAAGSA
jgi:hypothetical protein